MIATADRISNTDDAVHGDRWQAVLERDASFDGVFVYGVRSTGIYCRPSCPSRKPQHKHVAFFPVPEVAEQAGFRPCLRCKPQMQPSQDPHLILVRRVCQRITEDIDGIPTLAELAEMADVSPNHLQKTFRRVVGVTPRQYADAYRLGTLKESLKNGRSVTDALYEAGYGSSSRLYEGADARLGMTPAVYRRDGRGMQISYVVTDCHLGKLLVAATERGVCAVSIGDDEASLEIALRREYRAAEIRRADRPLNAWLGEILEHISGERPHVALPLDIQATAFQRMVWEQLQRIPYGETRSYGEIAEAIGMPKSARAVARACGANPTALAIPCHRAVRKDGTPGGYRWGVERKEKLLAQERATTLP